MKVGLARKLVALSLLAIITPCAPAAAGAMNMTPFAPPSPTLVVRTASCKSYKRCRQAVVNWCNGSHPGADRDKDKIPCENVCKSRKQVRKIAREIGCAKGS